MHSFNFSDNPLKDWHTDQNWLLLDPTVKGFFSQLVLSSSQTRPYGHITSNEKRIKRILGVPHVELKGDSDFQDFLPKKGDLAKTLKLYFEQGDNKGISSAMLESLSYSLGDDEFGEDENILFNIQHSYNMWLTFLWNKKWKPQLETLMMIIDDDLISKFPELEGKQGDYFIPIAYNIGAQRSNSSQSHMQESKVVAKKPRKVKKEAIEIVPLEELYFDIEDDYELKERALQMVNTNMGKSLSFKHVYKSLLRPLSDKEKSTIWDLGISLISLSEQKSDINKARAIMAKAMKTYGKDATVAAITKMSLIKDKQLNPHAYFIKLLTLDKEASDAAEKQAKSKIGANQSFVLL